MINKKCGLFAHKNGAAGGSLFELDAPHSASIDVRRGNPHQTIRCSASSLSGIRKRGSGRAVTRATTSRPTSIIGCSTK